MGAAPLRAREFFQASAGRSLVEGQARRPRLIMNRSEAPVLSGLRVDAGGQIYPERHAGLIKARICIGA